MRWERCMVGGEGCWRTINSGSLRAPLASLVLSASRAASEAALSEPDVMPAERRGRVGWARRGRVALKAVRPMIEDIVCGYV